MLQNLSLDQVSSSSSTNRSCQNHFNLFAAFAISTRYIVFHLFKFGQEKITRVTMLIFRSFQCNCADFTMFLVMFLLSKWLFQSFVQSFHVALSQNSIVKQSDWQLYLWLVFLFMANFSLYGSTFLSWSFHIWYTVMGNTCYIFSAIIFFALVQSSYNNFYVYLRFFCQVSPPYLNTLPNYTLS